MARSSRSGSSAFDWITFAVYISLVVVGWLMLYATEYNTFSDVGWFSWSSPVGKQSMWIGFSLIAFMAIILLDWKTWNTFAYLIYGTGVALLVGVLIFGTEIKGSKAWYSFSFFSFQPSEFAKFGTALALASFLSTYNTNLRDMRSVLTALAIIFVPIGLIILQPDAGSAIVFMSFFLVLYYAGLNPLVYVIGFSFILAFVLSLMFGPQLVILGIALIGILILLLQQEKRWAWLGAFVAIVASTFLIYDLGLVREAIIGISILLLIFGIITWQQRKQQIVLLLMPAIFLLSAFSIGADVAFKKLRPHQQDRINAWLQPDKADPQRSYYNINQSRLAISSGGFKGKGFLQGTMTNLNYVPEQNTDFIFSTVGEEQGFIGVLGVIILYTLLMLRITVIGNRGRNPFVSYYAYALVGLFFIHFFVNIGMTMGMMPVIGIPLPFLSQGGSSLFIFTIAIAVLLRMDMIRHIRM